ncbi:hypothetical protein [Candidatus Ichthyocystis hellenicum]|uniref:hypothetical protein n=1 Tax=Candidatus Ichthyocystis hellenicum TaxID=1561003 RepID=UPI000B81DD5B|nr:hypothetical protein [Candidatus Ichthyocystis hellenicum]
MLESATNSYSPCTLQGLAIGSLLDFHCKESIDILSHLTIDDVRETSLLIKRDKTNFTKYESVLENYHNSDGIKFTDNYEFSLYHDYSLYRSPSLSCKFEELEVLTKCRMYINQVIDKHDEFYLDFTNPCESNSKWGQHPICQVIYNENCGNIFENYDQRKNIIFSLPEVPQSGKELEETFYYQDPLIFFPVCKDIMCSPYLTLSKFENIASSIIRCVNIAISILKESSSKIRRKLFCLLMASCVQVKHSALLLKKYAADRKNYEIDESDEFDDINLHEKELVFIKSLDVIICVNNLMQDISSLKEKTIKITEFCNFVPLEDAIKIFKNRISATNAIIERINLLASTEKTDDRDYEDEDYDDSRYDIEYYEASKVKPDVILSGIEISRFNMTSYLLGLRSPNDVIKSKLIPYISESEGEISKISSFLKIKYQSLIASKKLKMAELKNETDKNKLEQEIAEMESFIKDNA